MSFIKFGMFSIIISSNIFTIPFFFWASNNVYVGPLNGFQQVPQALCTFIHLFPFYSSDLLISISLSSSFPILSSVSSNLQLNFSSEFSFHSTAYNTFLAPEFLLGFPSLVIVSVCSHIVFFSFSISSFSSLSILKIAVLKSLSSSSAFRSFFSIC